MSDSMEFFFDEGLIHEVLRPLKQGKEASVHLCRADRDKTGHDLAALKVYRPLDRRDFRDESIYRDGEWIKDGRVRRALENKSSFGRVVQAGMWVHREWEILQKLSTTQVAPSPIALHDDAAWAGLMGQLSSYQDSDGLFAYFPLSRHLTQGSDVLTAHLLAAAQESGRALPTTQLTKALDGLAAFVEGRIERRHWSPRPDEEPRRIAALAALARHDKATVRQLGTVDGRNLPNWPTSATWSAK